MPGQEWVVAFAGSGNTSLENAAALLDNWITDRIEVRDFYVPDKVNARKQKGLAHVVSYLTETWAEFKTAPAEDLIGLLTDARASGADPYLVVVIGDGETPDDVTADLVEAALEAGIPVKDLASGLDDVVDEGEDAEKAPAEPVSAPERPVRRRRVTASPEPEKPAEAVSETRPKRRGMPRNVTGGPVPEDNGEVPPWETENPGEARRRAAAAGIAAAQKFSDVKEKEPAVREARDIPVTLTGIQEVVAGEVRRALADLLSGALNSFLPGGDYAVSVVPAQTGPTAAYIKDAEGSLRKRGRGKPRAGEEVVFLSEKEIEDATEKGLIEQ